MYIFSHKLYMFIYYLLLLLLPFLKFLLFRSCVKTQCNNLNWNPEGKRESWSNPFIYIRYYCQTSIFFYNTISFPPTPQLPHRPLLSFLSLFSKSTFCLLKPRLLFNNNNNNNRNDNRNDRCTRKCTFERVIWLSTIYENRKSVIIMTTNHCEKKKKRGRKETRKEWKRERKKKGSFICIIHKIF